MLHPTTSRLMSPCCSAAANAAVQPSAHRQPRAQLLQPTTCQTPRLKQAAILCERSATPILATRPAASGTDARRGSKQFLPCPYGDLS
jgi:hypothetical protein